MHSRETYVRAYPEVAHSRLHISYGLEFHESCSKHVEETFKAKKVYIIASPSLAKYTDGLVRLQKALGEKVAGVRMGIPAHTPFDAVVEIINDVREKEADCIVTIGGGSIIDGAKAIVLGVVNKIRILSDMEKLAEASDSKMGEDFNKSLAAPTIPIICITTTLSGGEYSQYSGMAPSLVILDPSITLTTPERTWISSGVRAIDHCCEIVANLNHDFSYDPKFLSTLQSMASGLLESKTDPFSLQARLKCQLSGAGSMLPLMLFWLFGASHGIGHMLGPLGVGHGETSCILLPAVMKYNARVNLAQQAKIKTALWSEPKVNEVLIKRGLNEEESDVGDALDALFRELGMPRSLKEVGIGRERFDWLAEMSLHDIFVKMNPVPLKRKEQILEILEMVVGDQ